MKVKKGRILQIIKPTCTAPPPLSSLHLFVKRYKQIQKYMRTDTIQAHAMCMQGLFTCINLITSQQLNHTHIHI